MSIIFSIQFIIVTALLFYFYEIVLKRTSLYTFNRIYLLSIPIIAVLLVTFPYSGGDIGSIAQVSDMGTEFVMSGPIVADYLESFDILLWMYLVGVLVMSIRFVIEFLTLMIPVVRSVKRNYQDITIIEHDLDLAPFSFLGYVFLNRSVASDIPAAILDHERVHINQMHSMDIILIELCRIIFWFDPSIHLIKSRIQLNHEFIADAQVLSNMNRFEYQQLLLSYMTDNQRTKLASSINFSLTKIRFKMMSKNHTRWDHIKSALMIPLVSFLIIACADSKGVSGEEMLYYWRHTAVMEEILTTGSIDDSVFADGVLLPIETEEQFNELQRIYSHMSRTQRKSVYQLPPMAIPIKE